MNFLDIGSIENIIDVLRNTFHTIQILFNDPQQNFNKLINFHRKQVQDKEKYGVYIIKQSSTKRILYIGKSGRVERDGFYRKPAQDIFQRLKDDREGIIKAQKWFQDLYEEFGSILIEIILLPVSSSPRFIEGILLQAHLNEFNKLPLKNNEL